MTRDSLGIRLALSFGLLVSILIGVGWWGLNRMGRINTEVNEILVRRWEKARLARQAVYYTNLNYRMSTDIFLVDHQNDKATLDTFLARRAENAQRINRILATIRAGADSDQERALLARIDGSRLPVTENLNRAIDLLTRQNKPLEARALILSITHPYIDDYHARWDDFVQYEEDQIGEARDRSEANYATARRISMALLVVAIFMATGIAVFVTRTLVLEVAQREQARLEVRKLNEGLERKVADRTAELARAIQDLESEVNDRKQREVELSRLAAIVESSDDAIIGISVSGTIATWNAAAERIYGYTASEIIGKPATFLTAWDWPEDSEKFLEQVEQGNVHQFETLHTRKDQRQIPVAVTLSPVRDHSGSVIGASLIARNISEQKRLEQMFRQSQKMEAVGRLAGGVAHDFNNLLSVIIGYCELLLDQAGEGSPLLKSGEQIKKAAERAATLTRQLLAFSRQQVLEVRVINLNHVVGEMEKMISRLIGEDIDLKTSLDPNLGSVRADPGQIEQVIMNLAVNGRDAMPEGGKLIVETHNVHLNEEYALAHPPMVPGDYVLLAITDTGLGMDAQTQAHIFEPFFTTKQQGKGTGLGLATVYGFVKQSGGFIWVYSEPGLGSTFKIYLPRVAEAVPAARPSERSSGTPRRSETVLLVEDENSLRALTRALLEQNGYKVLEAEGGSHAIEIARQYRGPIHLLLSDMVMPGMNGRAAAAQLTRMRPEMKVVFMSGYAGFVHRGVIETDEILIQKPFTREGLLQKLHEVLELQRQPTST